MDEEWVYYRDSPDYVVQFKLVLGGTRTGKIRKEYIKEQPRWGNSVEKFLEMTRIQNEYNKKQPKLGYSVQIREGRELAEYIKEQPRWDNSAEIFLEMGWIGRIKNEYNKEQPKLGYSVQIWMERGLTGLGRSVLRNSQDQVVRRKVRAEIDIVLA